MRKNLLADTYTSGQVSRITRINYRTLDHWARTGFLVPSIAAAGSGTDRLYCFKDVLALCMARDLRAQGISTRALRRIVDHLRRVGGSNQPLAEGGFIVAGKDVFKVGTTREDLISLLQRPNQSAFAFVFDVAKMEAELKDALKNDLPARKRPPRVKRVSKKKAS